LIHPSLNPKPPRARRSKLRMQEQRAAISAKGVAARRGESNVWDNVSHTFTPAARHNTRAEVAREKNIHLTSTP